ncbi:MAG: hypothetical protein OXR66_09600 [Candidatus Woesearchaeota archaeon]|nr:hypothetical protein [Candidatus Woesearchaeota archaeon]
MARVTDTLTEVLALILTGVDYASDVAQQLKKSVPVVFRQLEQLLKLELITKERDGKKVVYKANWEHMSAAIADEMIADINACAKYLRGFGEHELNRDTLQELKALVNDLPDDLLQDDTKIHEIVTSFFAVQQAQTMFQTFLTRFLDLAQHASSMVDMSFQGITEGFMHIFGKLEEGRQLVIAKAKFKEDENALLFMRLCRLHYLQQQAMDPGVNFLMGDEANEQT